MSTILHGLDRLYRNRVWCVTCGKTRRVDAAVCIAGAGWPMCCGQTMTIDSPEERAALRAQREAMREAGA